jgi:hypothetical protein
MVPQTEPNPSLHLPHPRGHGRRMDLWLRRQHYERSPSRSNLGQLSVSSRLIYLSNTASDFHQPRGAILGIMNSIYSLGALSMMISVPWVNDRYGRKASIVVGNIIMVLGAVLQTASVNREYTDGG